ncbi:type II secretion system protein [Desulfitobacterium sp.]|uniref:type IV pilus modification PilV family protein n=1 Tax=Desulfitobacterium sp. TaxID=49981 RepID=UPI002B1ED90B|nr:type II secretion system protein [Desulfitobacterium sp.]MEA4901300.1 type II secretion system protein [Desulfitobacterium sp.]
MKMDNRGFTLVETIASLAIVAILSTAIFQMFVLSGNFNHQAKEMDIVNVLVVHQAEEFKNDPVLYSTDPQYCSPRYYDRAGVSQSDATGAAFRVESKVTPSNAGPAQGNAPGNGYNPSFVATIDLADYINGDCDVRITEVPNPANPIKIVAKIEAKAASDATYTELASVDPSTLIHNRIPIRVNFPDPDKGIYSPHLCVINTLAGTEAEFYIFGAQADPADDFLINVLGASSLSVVPADSSKDTNYQLTLNVYRLNNESSEKLLTSYTVNKYDHH